MQTGKINRLVDEVFGSDIPAAINRLFSQIYKERLEPQELLLRPREALNFCDDVRRSLMSFDIPDEQILRSLL